MLCFGIDANYLNAQVCSSISYIETQSTDDLAVSSKNACNNQDQIFFLDWIQQLPYTLHKQAKKNNAKKKKKKQPIFLLIYWNQL